MSTSATVRTGRFAPGTQERTEQAERRDPRRRGNALCLSGGGYRAVLFHLGALRRLHEIGFLNEIDTISSVSGGSLCAGVLADLAIASGWDNGLVIEDFERQVAEPMRELTQRDVRTWPYVSTLPINFVFPGPRTRYLQRLLKREITGAYVRDLRASPEFIFCATDLTHAANFEISRHTTRSYKSPNYSGQALGWPLARALVASACFPPVFGPMPLGSPLAELRGGPEGAEHGASEGISLSDGGLYDNLALEPVIKSHAYVLVSDAGAPFRHQSRAKLLRRLRWYASAVMSQARAMRLRLFYDQRNDHGLQGTWWGIRWEDVERPLGYSKELTNERIARIRTDVDFFTRGEQEILENHGYCAAEAQLRERMPHLLEGATEARAPRPRWMDESRAKRALRHSHRRIWPPRLVRTLLAAVTRRLGRDR